jgi:hypothetical protein
MGYFDNLDNYPLNKYKKNLKMKKNYGCVLLSLDWWSIQFHYRLIVHQRPSIFYVIYNDSNLTVFDGLSNDNEVWMIINLKVEEYIYNFFLRFFLYLFRGQLSRLSK